MLKYLWYQVFMKEKNSKSKISFPKRLTLTQKEPPIRKNLTILI